LDFLVPSEYTFSMEKEPKNGEVNIESNINFSKVNLKYWSDEEINSFFDKRITALQNSNEFIEENKWQFDNFKKHIIGEGYSGEEMIKRFIQREIKNSTNAKEKATTVRNQLEEKKEEILEQVKLKLEKYLPDWDVNTTEIVFKVMEDADYRHPRNGKVEVDLWRLTFQDDVIENVVGGITHELLHEWMGESSQKYYRNENRFISIEDAKLSACNKTVDEGLAVLVSGMALSKHYEEQRLDYQKAIDESFKYFKDFFTITDVEIAKQTYRKGLNNMGPFYVVGYEVAKEVFERIDLNQFRILIAKIRENPKILFDEYLSLGGGKILPKI